MNELDRLIEAETKAEAARATFARRELARCRGVSWSGMAPEPAAPCPPATLQARGQARLAAREAWRAGADGAFISNLADCQAAARQAFTTAERARAGASRGEPVDWRLQVLDELAAQARAIAAGVRRARRALSS
ncbi:MAG: hypothetical protein C0481_18915 [Phenylobacterium sp.]|uniref:hypothetical protein n=1 Tax=Phenylobacterium sp. TaxID=1871053 RepID=UPI0025E604D5|nr:hypothetical protein [Phenylobacterium sp.]MBA4013938.1 hypothetical protein [Phenylobacterium sp.]